MEAFFKVFNKQKSGPRVPSRHGRPRVGPHQACRRVVSWGNGVPKRVAEAPDFVVH